MQTLLYIALFLLQSIYSILQIFDTRCEIVSCQPPSLQRLIEFMEPSLFLRKLASNNRKLSLRLIFDLGNFLIRQSYQCTQVIFSQDMGSNHVDHERFQLTFVD